MGQPQTALDCPHRAAYNLGDLGPFERIQATLGYHDFDADRNRRDFGHGWQLVLPVSKVGIRIESYLHD